ncbi:PQQ-binding-like beta-propeller repeat protein [Telmatocola sphagniphila]|uniref:PQQ-binding-like beta-propeller repeat protein n=1 Tax=Telmatocola sphagniphila TaxID=1123043 RepID=A0A8E6F0H9_9BACT|nr:PQQ-binding-like beta-propeller repeat protein [Telmatocola sphagniphila]QVL34556.1 PQQ-binding-like beta-propeller repeat protein [Telmatocola sphagniphila]
MQRLILSAIASCLILSSVNAQSTPTTADWDRLHLRQNWTAFVPIENRSDSLQKIQLFDNDLFVQNASGILYKLDVRSGSQVWRYDPPLPRRAIYPVAVNEKIVFFINSTNLIFLDRATGRVLFNVELGAIPSSGPTADSDRVFIPLITNKVVAYKFVDLKSHTAIRNIPQEAARGTQETLSVGVFEQLASSGNRTPSISVLQSLRPPFKIPGIDGSPSLSVTHKVYPPYTLEGGNATPSIVMVNNLSTLSDLSENKDRTEPEKIWTRNVRYRITFPVISVQAVNTIVLPSQVGDIYMTPNTSPDSKFNFKTDAEITAGLGLDQFEIYIPTADTYLYAYDIKLGALMWRQPAGGEVLKTPYVTEDSIYVVGGNAGLRRLDRRTGKTVWPAGGSVRMNLAKVPGDEVLAVNSKYVYAADSKNRLHVVDRLRGLDLSSISLGTLNITYSNDQDDRLILADSNGKIVCLEDKDIRVPVRVKKEPPKPVVETFVVPEPKKEMPKPPEKKAPEPKSKKDDAKKDEAEKKDADPNKN